MSKTSVLEIANSPSNPTEMAVPQLYLGVKEAAFLLKVQVSTVYAWVHQRKIRHRKHGSKLVFAVEDLREWSDRQVVEVANSCETNRRQIEQRGIRARSSLKSESVPEAELTASKKRGQ